MRPSSESQDCRIVATSAGLLARQPGIGQDLAHAEDAGHRRPDLVADRRQEGRLGLAGGLGRAGQPLRARLALLEFGLGAQDRAPLLFVLGDVRAGQHPAPARQLGGGERDHPAMRRLGAELAEGRRAEEVGIDRVPARQALPEIAAVGELAQDRGDGKPRRIPVGQHAEHVAEPVGQRDADPRAVEDEQARLHGAQHIGELFGPPPQVADPDAEDHHGQGDQPQRHQNGRGRLAAAFDRRSGERATDHRAAQEGPDRHPPADPADPGPRDQHPDAPRPDVARFRATARGTAGCDLPSGRR